MKKHYIPKHKFAYFKRMNQLNQWVSEGKVKLLKDIESGILYEEYPEYPISVRGTEPKVKYSIN